MVKQCPRCWDKVTSEDKICPNCGFDLVNRAEPSAKKVRVNDDGSSKKKIIVFPTARKKKDNDTTFLYKLSFVLALVWAIFAILGGIYNMVSDELLQGAGFLASGIISAFAFMFIRARERNILVCILLIVSGAATLQIPLLIVSVLVSLTVYFSGVCYHSK